jgi:hypothetical protein
MKLTMDRAVAGVSAPLVADLYGAPRTSVIAAREGKAGGRPDRGLPAGVALINGARAVMQERGAPV